MYRQAISKTAEDYVCNVLMYQKLEIKKKKKKKLLQIGPFFLNHVYYVTH